MMLPPPRFAARRHALLAGLLASILIVFPAYAPLAVPRVEAARWARKSGAMVITCSVISPGWSDGEGGGAVHRALTEALDGALFTACAGNVADRHWWGKFDADRNGYHQWQAGNIDNGIKPW